MMRCVLSQKAALLDSSDRMDHLVKLLGDLNSEEAVAEAASYALQATRTDTGTEEKKQETKQPGLEETDRSSPPAVVPKLPEPRSGEI